MIFEETIISKYDKVVNTGYFYALKDVHGLDVDSHWTVFYYFFFIKEMVVGDE